MKLRYFVLSVALACPASGSAMGLIPGNKDKAVWESLQEQVLKELGGSCGPVTRPAGRFMTAAMAGGSRSELPVNKVVTAKLHEMSRVKFVLAPEKKRGKGQDEGGLLSVTPPVTGTYAINSMSTAWIDVVDQEQNRFAKARHYLWVDFCGQRMKAGIFELRAGARYWIQVSASPDSALDLFVAGPINSPPPGNR